MKISVAILWVLFLSAFFIAPESTISWWGRVSFWGMAGVHFLEFLAYLPTLRQARGAMGVHFINVIIFGYIYYQEVKSSVAHVDSSE